MHLPYGPTATAEVSDLKLNLVQFAGTAEIVIRAIEPKPGAQAIA